MNCYYCEREIDAAKFGGSKGIWATEDHIVPKSRFGKDCDANKVIACNQCNSIKNNLMLTEFLTEIKLKIKHNQSYKSLKFELLPII